MRRSFLRLVASTVLVFWAGVIGLYSLFAQQTSWIDDRARTDGVFLARDLLEDVPPAKREAQLAELRQHFAVELSLLTVQDVEARLGREIAPGEEIPHPISVREQWYFFVFEDHSGVLAAGPVHAVIPPGIKPLGGLLAILIVPVLAGLLAVRVEREIRKVEQASEALASGRLDARVDNEVGPSAELAASFNAMAERVESLIRSRDELVQAVSHELGSPLSRLRFHLELLADDEGAARHERLETIAGELDQLDDLVAELLTYVQSDESKLDLSTFDPDQGLSDLVELAVLESEDREVELSLHPDVMIHADKRLFLRAIENLLRNATLHAAGRVLLEVDVDGEFIRVSVHDDGRGIPEESRANVTSPFVRLEADRGRASGGAGLGLAIVSRIMDQHDGHLVIGDSPMGGAVVSTFWPAT